MKFTLGKLVEKRLTLLLETDDFGEALRVVTRTARFTIGAVTYWIFEEVSPGKRVTLGHTIRDADGIVSVRWNANGVRRLRLEKEVCSASQ